MELLRLQDTFENPLESAELTREPKDNIGENPSTHGNKEDFTSCMYATGKELKARNWMIAAPTVVRLSAFFLLQQHKDMQADDDYRNDNITSERGADKSS